jgi:bla regulator protein blaR1
MNAADLSPWTPLANHLWQSTACVGVISLLMLALKNNRAAVRYWLWFAASFKFLIPFSVLVALGSRLTWRIAAPAAQSSRWSLAVDIAVQPFTVPTVPTQTVSPHTTFSFAPVLIAVWLCGVAVGVIFWLRWWRRMRTICRDATPLPLRLPIPALSCASQIEPGVFGVLRPVLLLPEGIESRLAPAQLDAILAHEMSHVRRLDNLTASVHMLVETLFWFFPVVWWLRSRLLEEREQACDEEVLRLGSEAEAYAAGIIQVCRSYKSHSDSPAAYISGISGSDLKKRIIRILNRRQGRNLPPGKKIVLAAIGVAAAVAPLAIGLTNAPLLRAQSRATDWEKAAGGKMSFAAASVTRNVSDLPPTGHPLHSNVPLDASNSYSPAGGLLSITNFTVSDLISFAYKLDNPEEKSMRARLPKWSRKDHFNIQARGPANATKDQVRLMMQPLLADYFKLAVHFEAHEGPIYRIVLAKPGTTGPQLMPYSEAHPCIDLAHPAAAVASAGGESPGICGGMDAQDKSDGGIHVREADVTIQKFADDLPILPPANIDGPVVDRTGLTGNFNFAIDLPAGMSRAATRTDEPVPSFVKLLQDQLGLKLEATTGPVEYLIIDHIEEPSPNQ